jgi:hypothetical protein
MDIAVLGIDLGKNSCRVAGLDGSGKVILCVACNAKPSWAWLLSSRPASLRWKPAAASIIWEGFRLRHTQFG